MEGFRSVESIDVSSVDWNGHDNWKSMIEFIRNTESNVYSANVDNELVIVYVQKGEGAKRVDWHGRIATIHYYDLVDGTIVFSETFEIDDEYGENN